MNNFYSTCCGSNVYEDTDICAECEDHTGAEDEQGNIYEFSVNQWVLSKDQKEN